MSAFPCLPRELRFAGRVYDALRSQESQCLVAAGSPVFASYLEGSLFGSLQQTGRIAPSPVFWCLTICTVPLVCNVFLVHSMPAFHSLMRGAFHGYRFPAVFSVALKRPCMCEAMLLPCSPLLNRLLHFSVTMRYVQFRFQTPLASFSQAILCRCHRVYFAIG